MATHSILVVDDEELNRDVLERRLGKQGYQVTLASSGREAIELIQRQPFDLVLLDVMMPEMDGLEVLMTIRESHPLATLPVIMVTGRDQSGDLVAALQVGANDYVAKPINFPILLARIQTQLLTKVSRATVPSAVAAARASDHDIRKPASDPSGSTFKSLSAVHETPAPRLSSSGFPIVPGYEILEELGRGGMGVIYKARQVCMNREVAIKIIDHAYTSHPDAAKRFYKEAQALAQLNHPNVVMVYDAGFANGTHYLAMEYVLGIDLAKLLKQKGTLSVSRSCDLMRQCALGLQHAFERNLVHRDIKPSNLLLTFQPKTATSKPSSQVKVRSGDSMTNFTSVVKILDFGLALLCQPEEIKAANVGLTREGKLVGTADYMSPEQWKNPHKVDIRADLYSLGCTFYQLLTGRVPFPAESPMEKMLMHVQDEPKPLARLCPGVPPRIVAIVGKLMAKRPEDRYQMPIVLAEQLEDVQSKLGSSG